MNLSFSESTFIEIVSSEIFDNCISKYGDFAHDVFAKLIEKEQDEERKDVLRVISNFCSMYMKDDNDEPFGPMFTINGTRSFLPEDVSKDLADIIYKNIDKVKSIAIKARLCDTLWLIKLFDNKTNIACAKIAVSSYYFLIDQFILERNLYAATMYLNRLYHLILKMPGTPEREILFENLLKYADVDYDYSIDSSNLYWHSILNKISGFQITDKTKITKYYRKTLDIIKVLLKQDFYIFPDDAFYGSEKLQELAAHFPEDMNFIWIRKFYDIAITFAKILDETNVNDLLISKAKTFEYEAQLRPQMNMFAHWLKEAIYIYRILPNRKADINRLTSVIEHDTISMPYATFSHSVDVTEFVKTAQENVTGKELKDAIFSLVALFGMFFGNSLNKEKARERAINIQKKSPLLGLFTQVSVDEHGHIIATTDKEEELLNLNMMRNLWIENEISYIGIREAVNIINMEHHYEYKDILQLMANTSFVPDRHKIIVAKGIYAFLKDDMMVAAHFLICQFEDCLRYVLEHIETTMKIVSNHEEEKNTSIEYLLGKCVENNILPDGLAWLFNSYFVVKNKNIRNSLAHGFMIDQHYYSLDVQIVCYCIMYLVFFHPAIMYFESKQQSQNQGTIS